METQQDSRERLVALTNLRAMCERISGTCHRYAVVKVTRSRVHVEYSNPDEYGHERPMVAVFPSFPSPWLPGDKDNPRVLLDIHRVLHDSWDGEGWQAFTPLLDCPTLWRGPNGEGWHTHRETGETEPSVYLPTRQTCRRCAVCDLVDND
jgi:hypothetical protein